MKVAMIIIALTLLLLFLLILFVSIYLAHFVVFPKLISIKETIEIEKSKNLYFDFDKYEKQDFKTNSFDGYVINGTFVKNEIKSNKYVIISHGYTYTRYGGLKYLDVFYKLGYNCIIVDDRGHGENKRFKCTMGLNESKDLIAIIENVYNTFGKNIYLGLHGESMGSGLQIMALKYQPKVKFIVNDCGYGILKNVLEDQLRLQFHLPKFLIKTSGLMSKLLYNFDFTTIKPIEYLKDNYIPICFIHGLSDTFINPEQSKLMYDETKGYKEIHLIENAEHAKSFEVDPVKYHEIVSNFVRKIEIQDRIL